MQFILALVCLAILGTVMGYHGVDVSQSTSSSDFSCMKSNGYSFAVARVYCSSGHTDSAGPGTITAAWNGGMSHVDGYIFPCYSCGNPAGQMDDTISYLANHGVLSATDNSTSHIVGAKYGMLWIDVEGTQYWSSNQANNVNFIVAMANEGVKKGVSIGIYTSNSQWSPITGGSTQLSKYPLWYPHYDGSASFSDFVPFGGWSKPAIKQYAGTTSFCGASVDKNYY